MEKMKTKLIDKINTIFSQIEDIDKQLTIGSKNGIDKSIVPEMSTKLYKSLELNGRLFALIELFIEEYTLTELPEVIQKYYEFAETIKKEVSDSDSDEMKQLKQIIKSQNGGN